MAIYYFDKHPKEYNSRNFGDDINPFLLGRILSDSILKSEKVCVLGIGTIINDVHINAVKHFEKKVVFSSGVGYGTLTENLDDSWDFVCVRGPRSAESLSLPTEKGICDGAVLLSDFFDVKPQEKRDIGVTFIPHIATHWSSGIPLGRSVCALGMNYLTPDVEPEIFIDQVSRSKLVITEAMHGAILADTMRVPWIPVSICEHLNYKWMDWFDSMDMKYQISLVKPTLWNPRTPQWKVGVKIPYSYLKSILVRRSIAGVRDNVGSVMSNDAVLSERKKALYDCVDYINKTYS